MKYDQAAILRQKMQTFNQPYNSKTIAVLSGKDGVGKSNITVNFSLALIESGKKVLVVDMDIGMGNSDILLGLQVEKTMIDMFEDNLSLFEIIQTGPRNLDYIAAGSGLSSIFSMKDHHKQLFFNQYGQVIGLYDYVIFDMGAGVTRDAMSFVLASDECFIVTTPEPTAITDAYSMIKHILHYNHTIPIQVIMNRSQSGNKGWKLLERFTKVVDQFLHVQIGALGVLPYDKTVNQAVINQTPFFVEKERSTISKAMRKMAGDYLKTQNNRQDFTSSSFLQKLKQIVKER
ncbi:MULTISPECIES: MinD/ParA family protein [Virgibacillus]|uniref:MinD/ParA family protein n=1 Tax=Virgibacillus TaxID=84406 RepID=UPI0003889B70|nr:MULTISPECIES: MinD/ParA family protein [Virgibacillus]EQB36398.1 hypothetical protein M948_15315 [Virgibacillus sp. CM-4]MYL42231.1 AAA family ATPase [Virgibacillus massiliensis]